MVPPHGELQQLIRIFEASGGVIREMPRMTREALFRRDDGAPLLLMPGAVTTAEKVRILYAAIGAVFVETVQPESLLETLRFLFHTPCPDAPDGDRERVAS